MFHKLKNNKTQFCKISISVLLLICSFSRVFAQDNPPLRIDIPLSSANAFVYIESLKQDGLLLLTDNNDGKSWSITHYDTLLRTKTSKKIDLGYNLSLRQTFFDNTYFCAGWQHQQKNTDFNTFFLLYNIIEKKIQVFALNIPNNATLTSLACGEQIILFELQENKNQKTIYVFDCHKIEYMPLFADNRQTSMQTVHFDTLNHLLKVGCLVYQDKQTSCLLVDVDSLGKPTNEINISISDKYKIQQFDFHQFGREDNKMLVCGTFFSQEKTIFSSTSANGLFVIPIINAQPQQAKFIDYLQMEKMFADKKKAGNASLYSHHFTAFANDTAIVAVTEFFVPEYEQDMQTMSMYYGGTPMPTMRFVGFRYLHAAIFYMDMNGNLKTCNGLNFNGLMLKDEQNILNAFLDEDDKLLVYFAYDAKAYSIIYQNNKIVQPIQAENIDLTSKNELLSKNLSSAVQYWYDNYFFYYGYQRLFKKGNTKRNAFKSVFFISKMIYD